MPFFVAFFLLLFKLNLSVQPGQSLSLSAPVSPGYLPRAFSPGQDLKWWFLKNYLPPEVALRS
jgi:hypothetical protein